MEFMIELVIFLVSVFGIIITTISFYEVLNIENKSYRIYSKKSNDEKNVDIIVKIEGYNEIEEKEVIELLSRNTDLKEISNNIIIQKEDY